jgi:hypothetical protein
MRQFDVGNVRFSFGESWKVLEFDKSTTYVNGVGAIEGASAGSRSKGVDIVGSYRNSEMLFLEATDYRGYSTAESQRPIDKHAVEVAQKVCGTLAAIVGASRMHTGGDWREFAKLAIDNRKQLHVVYHYDGNSARSETRRRKAGNVSLNRSLRQKLHWLDCKIHVTSTKTFSNEIAEVEVANLAGAGRP